MPLYEFICSAPNGKEVRGECKARNKDELAHTLAGTGLTLKWSSEKDPGISSTISTQAFAKEVAGILHKMDAPRWYKHKSTPKEKLQSLLLALFLGGVAVALYFYLDSRIALLEQLNFQPNLVRQIHHHAIQDAAAPE